MSLTAVKMSEEVWLTCLTHALSTETEEIMGLLLGDIQRSKKGTTALIWGASPQTRSDRQKDRVETNPEQLAAASAQAEISFAILISLILDSSMNDFAPLAVKIDYIEESLGFDPQGALSFVKNIKGHRLCSEHSSANADVSGRMTISTGRTTRVIGWYHSHPHITVLPSHVDVRTQAMYQLLDSGFLGLIFSCFSEDSNKIGRIQVIAFQSSDGNQSQISRPIPVSPVNIGHVIDLESSLSSLESASSRSGAARGRTAEEDTGDSRMSHSAMKEWGRSSELGNFFANAEFDYLRRDINAGSYHSGNQSSSSVVEVDPIDMSDSMKEAMYRSNLDMSGAEYVRKEVPLHVVPSSVMLNLDSPLISYTDLQHVIYEEEREAFGEAMGQQRKSGRIHPLTFIHHTSTYQASMCKLIEYCLSPAIRVLQDRLRENEVRIAMLIEEAKALEREALRVVESPSGSSMHVTSPNSRTTPSLSQRNMPGSSEVATSRSTGSPRRRSKRGF